MKKPKYGEIIMEYKGYVIRFFEKGFLAIPKKSKLIHCGVDGFEFGNKYDLSVEHIKFEIDKKMTPPTPLKAL